MAEKNSFWQNSKHFRKDVIFFSGQNLASNNSAAD